MPIHYVRANPSTAQTLTNLLAPLPNQGVRVHDIYISSDTEMAVSLFDSETHGLLWRQYVGARGGAHVPSSFLSLVSEGIDYSTSAAGNVFLMVGYEVVGRKLE